jgi:alanine racemase
MGLRPAMTLKCPEALVRPISRGDGVSYGHTGWVFRMNTRVAAAGLMRVCSAVSVDDSRCPSTARIERGPGVHGPVPVDLGPGPSMCRSARGVVFVR